MLIPDILTLPGGDVMLPITAGTFDMGCTAGQSGCDTDEKPAHTVTLTKDFWMSETEVTQGAYEAVMGTDPSSHSSCGTDCPVDTVSWDDVAEYANALSDDAGLEQCYSCTSGTCVQAMNPYDCVGYRMPTEAEWEYAARAGTDLRYAGSDTIGDVAWYAGNSVGTTHPVATKDPNAWGLYDMSGNVTEWVHDWFGSTYYSSSPASDPAGPTSSGYRVFRGGTYTGSADYLRVVDRNGSTPGARYSNIGIRLARTVP